MHYHVCVVFFVVRFVVMSGLGGVIFLVVFNFQSVKSLCGVTAPLKGPLYVPPLFAIVDG